MTESYRFIENAITQYSIDNKPLEVSFRQLIPNLQKTERATHLIHPYPAKLLMHIPYFFLSSSIFSQKGDTVLDPFCGSGTVVLESLLSGRNAIGVDANPLAHLIAEVKTGYYKTPELRALKDIFKKPKRLTKSMLKSDSVDLDYWFLPHIKNQMSHLLKLINSIEDNSHQKFFLLCLSNLVKKVSLADPRVSVPVRLKSSNFAETHPLRKKTAQKLKSLKTINVFDKFIQVVDENINRLDSCNNMRDYSVKSKILSTDIRNLATVNEIQFGNVDLIITSPPYAGAQKYVRSSSLNLELLKLSDCSLKELENISIGREHYKRSEYLKLIKTGIPEADSLLEKIFEVNPLRAHIASNYLLEMKEAFKVSTGFLKENGYFILVVGNNKVCGYEFNTQEYLTQILEQLGMKVLLKMIDDIRSYGLMTKRNKTASIITREWVLVFQK